jgi:hypothetical protein
MCKTTQLTPSATAAVTDDDKASIVACPNGCPTATAAVTPKRTRKVQFHDTVSVYDTFCTEDLTDHEKTSYWITDQDWEEMRQEFFRAKRNKCPTVEMSQPYRMADRKATIRYARLVVLREEQKFRQSLQQWKEVATTATTTTTTATQSGKENHAESNVKPAAAAATSEKFPCWTCWEHRMACLYRMAAKKSVLEAQEQARLCAKEMQRYSSEDDEDFGSSANCHRKTKFLTAITACY